MYKARENSTTREQWEASRERRWKRERYQGANARDEGEYVPVYHPISRITAYTDSGPAEEGAKGNERCPHCGTHGRYIYWFETVEGDRHGAMAGCVELWPGGRQAVARYKKVLARLDKVRENIKQHGLDIGGCYNDQARVLPEYQGLLATMLDKAAKYDMTYKQAGLIGKLLAEHNAQ